MFFIYLSLSFFKNKYAIASTCEFVANEPKRSIRKLIGAILLDSLARNWFTWCSLSLMKITLSNTGIQWVAIRAVQDHQTGARHVESASAAYPDRLMSAIDCALSAI